MDSTVQLNNLPDLPELETVEVRNWQMLMMLSGHIALAFLFAGTIVWLYLRLREYIDPRMAAVVWLTAGLAVWTLLRLLFAGLYWKTDRRGLTIRGILYHRFIEWTEVEEAQSERTTLRELVYSLRTRKGTVIAPTRIDGSRKAGQELAASICQHLRHLGKSDSIELPAEALSFWDTIPDDLPREMDWRSPGRMLSPTRIALASALVPATVMAVVTYIACSEPRNWFLCAMMSLMVVPITGLFYGEYRNAMRRAFVLSLSDHGFEAVTPGGRLQALWSEVTGASWDRSGFVIRAGRRQLHVPYVPGDDNNGKLILAVVRRLRTAGQPTAVVIPDVLRSKCGDEPEAAGWDDATIGNTELKCSTPEKVLIILMTPLLLSLGPLWIDTRFHSALLTATAVGFTVILGILVASSYYYRVTPEGAEKRLFWYHRYVRWERVASYDFRITPQHQYRKWILRDADRNKLIDITLDLGSAPAKEVFQRHLKARLALILPEAARKPWLARPFSPPQQ